MIVERNSHDFSNLRIPLLSNHYSISLLYRCLETGELSETELEASDKHRGCTLLGGRTVCPMGCVRASQAHRVSDATTPRSEECYHYVS